MKNKVLFICLPEYLERSGRENIEKASTGDYEFIAPDLSGSDDLPGLLMELAISIHDYAAVSVFVSKELFESKLLSQFIHTLVANFIKVTYLYVDEAIDWPDWFPKNSAIHIETDFRKFFRKFMGIDPK